MKDLAVDIGWLAVAITWVTLTSVVVISSIRALRNPRQRKEK